MNYRLYYYDLVNNEVNDIWKTTYTFQFNDLSNEESILKEVCNLVGGTPEKLCIDSFDDNVLYINGTDGIPQGELRLE